jgi:adenine-specific DNA-methyltransferase
MTESTGAPASSVRPEALPLTSPDLAAARLARLRELLPGAFAEGKLVPEKLAELVGAAALSATPERYGLSYAGRAEALRETLAPSPGTLRPDREKSVAWDATENLVIEGDNLHVLKLLQSAYAGAVKLIYIDPPYNTGNDFVYPDDFRAGVKHYKELTQQTLSTNAETSGRYHSDWLKMMHPRLALARNLLRDDGVIFVSIDDHEVHNLRLLMDEVFGEENFIGEIVWKCRQFPDARAGSGLSTDHEYLVAYSWNAGVTLRGVPRDESKFDNPDNDPRGAWMSRSLLGLAPKEARPNLHYSITDPKTGQIFNPPADTGWRYAKDRMERMIEEGKILFPASLSGRPREKKFRAELESENKAFPSIIDDVFTSGGTKDIRELFGTDVIQFPKPAELIQRVIAQAAGPSDLILDFFAGSGTTGQAVLELNRQDGGNRKFILVQFPEPTGRADFPTIADITRERVRRVIQKLNAKDAENTENQKAELPLSADSALKKSVPGFRAYRLDDSNFKLWDGDAAPADAAALAKQLELIAHNVLDGRGDEDVLAELLLKCGHPGVTLTSAVETRAVAGAPVHLLAEGRLAICLGRALTPEILRGVIALQPQRVLCLDVGFQGNDPLKTNTVLEMKSHGIQFQTV